MYEPSVCKFTHNQCQIQSLLWHHCCQDTAWQPDAPQIHPNGAVQSPLATAVKCFTYQRRQLLRIYSVVLKYYKQPLTLKYSVAVGGGGGYPSRAQIIKSKNSNKVLFLLQKLLGSHSLPGYSVPHVQHLKMKVVLHQDLRLVWILWQFSILKTIFQQTEFVVNEG